MRILAALAAAVLALQPLPAAYAQDVSPAGVWQAEDGKSHWTVEFCGRDGQQLCAHLSWIRPDALNDDNRQYVGQSVFENLPRHGRYRWTGIVTLLGYTVQGTVTLIAGNELRVGACAYIVVCRSTVLTRVASAD